jgi:hypothetical protein
MTWRKSAEVQNKNPRNLFISERCFIQQKVIIRMDIFQTDILRSYFERILQKTFSLVSLTLTSEISGISVTLNDPRLTFLWFINGNSSHLKRIFKTL